MLVFLREGGRGGLVFRFENSVRFTSCVPVKEAIHNCEADFLKGRVKSMRNVVRINTDHCMQAPTPECESFCSLKNLSPLQHPQITPKHKQQRNKTQINPTTKKKKKTLKHSHLRQKLHSLGLKALFHCAPLCPSPFAPVFLSCNFLEILLDFTGADGVCSRDRKVFGC